MAEFCHWHFGRPFLALRHNLESLPIYHLTLKSSIREPVVAGSAAMRWKTEILHSSCWSPPTTKPLEPPAMVARPRLFVLVHNRDGKI